MNVFVYGALRPGGSLFDEIQDMVHGETDAYFEGRLFVLEEGYPIVVEGPEAYPVTGVLLDVPESPISLERLDRIEGVRDPKSPYRRVQRRVGSDRGDEMAWIYVCKEDFFGSVMSACTELDQGDWFLHQPPT